MKKHSVLCLVMMIIVLTLSVHAGAESQFDADYTPEIAYAEICSILGEPQSIAARNTFNSVIGEGAAADQLLVIDSMDSFYFAINRKDVPSNMYIWLIKPVSDDDYKTLFSILHQYTDGYGISDDNRCLYLKMEVGSPFDLYYTTTDVEPDGEHALANVDEMLASVIVNLHPKLSDWAESELF